MASLSTAEKQHRVEQHLLDRIDEGPLFVKSKFVASDVSLSTREVGAALGRLSEESDQLAVSKWAYTGSTTWQIDRQ
jgi:hypothetical protein